MDLREKILKTNDIKRKKVYVKEWDCDIFIKQMNGAEREEFEREKFIIKNGNVEPGKNIAAKLLQKVLVDENNKNIFEKNDIEALSGKNANVLDFLLKEAQDFNLTENQDLEESKKN